MTQTYKGVLGTFISELWKHQDMPPTQALQPGPGRRLKGRWEPPGAPQEPLTAGGLNVWWGLYLLMNTDSPGPEMGVLPQVS